ncbi:unnamed protein product [Effrenium voratum]|nr:unnamed protein product [Effrenium voratum]
MAPGNSAQKAPGRPPLPKELKELEAKAAPRKSNRKKPDANTLTSFGLPIRLPEKDNLQREVSGSGQSVSAAVAKGVPPVSRTETPSEGIESMPARRVRYDAEVERRDSDVGTHSWPLAASPKEDAQRSSERPLTMFFLDPAQLLANIKDEKNKDVALDDDDDLESKATCEDEKESKSPRPESRPELQVGPRRSSLSRPAVGNEYIQVAVRIRPNLVRNEGDRCILTVDSDNQIIVEGKNPERKNSAAESPLQSHRETGTRTFKFDHVLDSRGREGDMGFASQETVYERIGHHLVSCALDGYNACLFAYGQTGAGKTHTVLGDVHVPEKRGLLPRVIEGLFAELDVNKERLLLDTADKEDADSTKKNSLQISYLEIFNEQIHDLLVPPKVGEPRQALQVRYHPSLGVMINDLTTSSASNFDEAMELVNFGTRMRSIASTSMNHRSSRAHTVFTFRFEQTSKDGETQMAQVQLVDLAGREQEKSSVDNKDRLKERQFINTSLFHLTTCIINLSKASKGRKMNLTDFAFRRSRLTLLLAHSLSGNSRTGMVAAVSPASSDLDETISTLRFADMVKQIRTTVTSNRVNKANLIKQLQDEITRLKSQMEMNARCNADEQIGQLEAVCAHFKDALEQEKSRSEALALERAACLKDMGLSVNTEGVSIVVAADSDAGVPYLVNLSEDPYLQGCLMYFLPSPEVTIGSSDGNKVRMSGLGMKQQHCCIRNEGNRRLTLQPIPASDEKDFPRVLLNGRRVTEPVEIRHQDRLILGHAWAFRLAVPLTASELRAADPSMDGGIGADNQAELDQALAEIEDSSSQSFRHLRKYVEDLQRCAGPDCARDFVRELHRSVPLVDEANQITREVGVDCYFELQVLTDLWSLQNLPEMVVVVLNNSRRSSVSAEAGDGDAPAGLWQPTRRGTLKFVWTFSKFLSRLQSMRDIYEEMCSSRNSRALMQRLDSEPFSNPWQEFEEHEIRMMLATKSGNSGSPIAEARVLAGLTSPGTEARLMLHGYKSGNFGKSTSDASLALASAVTPTAGRREVEALDAKSDELLAKSQFLLEGASALLLQDHPRPGSCRSTVVECLDPEEESRMQELELKVEEGMKKFQLYWGRRGNPSMASSFLANTAATPKAGANASRHWASQGLFQATKSVACGDSRGRSAHQGSASSSSEGSWGIEDDTRETGEAVVPRLTLRAPTMADAMSLEQALHAENSILEREVARQRAEIQELKKKRSHAPQEPRVAVGGTTSRSTSSRSGSKTPAQGGAGSVPVPRFVPRAAGSTTCTMQRSPQSPRVMQGVATPVCSPRGEVPSRLCAYLPTNGWVYAAPASSQAQTPRTSAAPVRTATSMFWSSEHGHH